MTDNSEAAPREASQAPGDSEHSPQGNEGRNTPVVEASVNAEAHFPPAMLLQMRTPIEGVIDGVEDKKHHAFGMNPKSSEAHYEARKGRGSKTTPGAHKHEPRDAREVPKLARKLPFITMAWEENTGPKGLIQMIHGGPAAHDFGNSLEAPDKIIPTSERWEESHVVSKISFGPKDNKAIIHQHNDTLVVTVEIEGYQIQRVFIDTGASVNVILEDCFNRMSMGKSLKPTRVALHGCSQKCVMIVGSVDLILTLGEVPIKASRLITFWVVNQRSSYNVVLGRTALNSFQAVVSTYHLIMKSLWEIR